MNAVSLEGIAKSFGSRVVIAGLDLDVPDGAFVTLLGPSGSGKSTILRLIAGLEMPDRGRIVVHGADVTAWPAHRRPTATVFQRYAIFPHMSVTGNVAFGLRQQRLAKTEIASRVRDALSLVSLADRGESMPHELSGGQEQRVALARALVTRPRVLLLDEPLAALDAGLRATMQQELRSLQRATGVTFLAVTHDQEEAMTTSDHMVILDSGRARQVGTPRDIYEHPEDSFVARFMGATNVVPVDVSNGAPHLGAFPIPVALDATIARPHAVIRPEAIVVQAEGLPARVTGSSYKGSHHLLRTQLGDGTELVVVHETALPAGASVHLAIRPNAIHIVPGA